MHTHTQHSIKYTIRLQQNISTILSFTSVVLRITSDTVQQIFPKLMWIPVLKPHSGFSFFGRLYFLKGCHFDGVHCRIEMKFSSFELWKCQPLNRVLHSVECIECCTGVVVVRENKWMDDGKRPVKGGQMHGDTMQTQRILLASFNMSFETTNSFAACVCF